MEDRVELSLGATCKPKERSDQLGGRFEEPGVQQRTTQFLERAYRRGNKL